MTIDTFLREQETQELLRFSTAGSVDDGKSTLIGRLLHDSQSLCEDHLAALEARKPNDRDQLDWALLTDGLKAEREQGITIDVAYRFFATPRRKFIIADTPGHEQYTRNMATGASTADLSIVLIDARHGVRTQSKRHAFIAALLQTPHLVVAVNKMDLVDFDRAVYERIRADFDRFTDQLGIARPKYVPISALRGDNVVQKSEATPWYEGGSLLEILESVPVTGSRNLEDLRFPVQYVSRPHADFRGYSGQIVSGVLRKGDELEVQPSRRRSRVTSIVTYDGELEEAFAPMSVTVTLADELDISRGAVLFHPSHAPQAERHLEAMVVWMDETPLRPNGAYLLKHTSQTTRVVVDDLIYKVDVNRVETTTGENLQLNEIGRLRLTTFKPLFFDAYQSNRATGSFILIDEQTNLTVAAGMIAEPEATTRESREASAADGERHVSETDRARRLGQRPLTLWLTGPVAAGQPALARRIERALFDRGALPLVLQSTTERPVSSGRLAADATLLNSAGLIAICATDLRQATDANLTRDRIGRHRLIEIVLEAPIEWCAKRDREGQYQRAAEDADFPLPGVNGPLEPPAHPDLRLPMNELTEQQALDRILAFLDGRGLIPKALSADSREATP
ncbi:sulfate adenylyltransferase subunit CysN [Sulfidibacter corallicola]|uniref:Sulfate adenylyltransferase subunit 1 n=1 Tax=Sulfidibacter corallicola TaxID=2818388 RepID=A0A8A4TVI0_SULCO|nr:sulfate adenylyltransferase subunit CysN [Sulfidibacter corallicola]QTD53520.1 sulfate adenylyltransferase subunit CysN [Sulfidibacter corallicola]